MTIAPNIDPIYSRQADVPVGTTTLATVGTADYTGVGSQNVTVFTAQTNGSFIQRLRFKAIGTNAATVARIYINNGSSQGTAANNQFYGEISLPATTASTTSATSDVDYPMNFALPPGYTILVGLGATVSAGWVVTAIGGDY